MRATICINSTRNLRGGALAGAVIANYATIAPLSSITTFPRGQSEYTYLLKVVNPGIFRVSPTRVEPMYQPQYLSTSDAATVTVK